MAIGPVGLLYPHLGHNYGMERNFVAQVHGPTYMVNWQARLQTSNMSGGIRNFPSQRWKYGNSVRCAVVSSIHPCT